MARRKNLFEVNQARDDLRIARDNLVTAIQNEAAARANLNSALRENKDVETAKMAHVTSLEALDDKRESEHMARGILAETLDDWLKIDSDGTEIVSPQEEYGSPGRFNDWRIDGGLLPNVPIVLFPVRAETRFQDDQLKIRIYPDEIFLDTHERALTEEEIVAAKGYYERVPKPGSPGETIFPPEDVQQNRWSDLVSRFGAPRSAYILRRMRPDVVEEVDPEVENDPCDSTWVNRDYDGGPDGDPFPAGVPQRPASWTRPGEAILPDRWMVVFYRQGVAVRNKDRALLVRHGKTIPEPIRITPDPGIQRDPEAGEGEEADPDLGGEEERTADGFIIQDELRWTIDYEKAEEIGMALTVDLVEELAFAKTEGFDRIVIFGVKSSLPPVVPTPEDGDTAGENGNGNGDPPPWFMTADYLERLFDAHHYTRGLAIVPQGTPTNNTEGQPSAFPPEDPFGENSFDAERLLPPFHRETSPHCHVAAAGGDDFDRISLALGLPNGVFRNVFGAMEKRQVGEEFELFPTAEQLRALLMNEALWPATWGNFLGQMMHPVLKEGSIDPVTGKSNPNPFIQAARDFFRESVRGRGPTPAFRIGAVPYGVLPAVSLQDVAARNDLSGVQETMEGTLIPLLQELRKTWLKVLDKAPHIRRPGQGQAANLDSMKALADVLAQDAGARQMRIQHAFSRDTITHGAQLLRQSLSDLINLFDDHAKNITDPINRFIWANARVFHLGFCNGSNIFPDPWVTAEGLPGPGEYIQAIKDATNNLDVFESLRDDKIIDNLTGKTNAPKPLLYKLIRHSVLYEFYRILRVLHPPAEKKVHFDFMWFEFHFIDPTKEVAPFYDMIFADKNGPQPGALLEKIRVSAKDHLNAVEALATELSRVPTAEAERLVTETLDVSSHRLDAWITGLASSRLFQVRNEHFGKHFSRTKDRFVKFPSYLGGYTFLEDVKPNRFSQGLRGGFIHAPSLAHAATASVLRHGHLSRRNDPGAAGKYALNLTSHRVREARRILDELRGGQTLGAILGFRFERVLREALGKDAELYLIALRKLYPLVADKAKSKTETDREDPYLIAARNVVDGWVLREAHKSKVASEQIPFGSTQGPGKDLPKKGSDHHTVIVAQLNALDALLDAVSDLVTAESVHQLVRGNVEGTGATLEAMAHGFRPPDPEIGQSPRTGLGLTHRVALAWSGVADNAPDWDAGSTARSGASSELDQLTAQWLGDPERVKATVTYTDDNNDEQSVEVLLGVRKPQTGNAPVNLDIRPLDLIALAQASAQAGERSLLDRRILDAALDGVPGWKDAVIQYAETGVTFPQIMEVARSLGVALAAARPLSSDDLSPPAESSASETGLRDDAVEFFGAARDAAGDLETEKQKLINTMVLLENTPPDDSEFFDQVDGLRSQMKLVAAFAPSAYPEPHPGFAEEADEEMRIKGKEALLALARQADTELGRRLNEANALLSGLPEESDSEFRNKLNAIFKTPDLRRLALNLYRAVFGREFLPAAPFTPPNAGEISHALESQAVLLPDPADQDAPLRMLAQAARVREPLMRWRRLALYGDPLGAALPELKIVQVPGVTDLEDETDPRWVGLRMQKNAQGKAIAFPRGRVSCVLAQPAMAELDPAKPLQGIFVDEWNEIIPAEEEDNGIAFNYDNPGAEAPQAILVAVSPETGRGNGDAGTWEFGFLLNTINETLDLAKIRAVEREHLPLGQALPATYLSFNAENVVPSTSMPPLQADRAPP